MAYRYHTNPLTCLREWRWYPVVGPAERASLAVACTRAAPFVAPAVGVAPSIASKIVPPGLAGTNGWGTNPPGLSAGSHNHPASLTDVAPHNSASAWANRVPQQTIAVRPGLPLTGGGSPTHEIARTLPGLDTATLQIPATVPPSAPSATPEPATLALLGAAFLAAGIVQAVQGGRR